MCNISPVVSVMSRSGHGPGKGALASGVFSFLAVMFLSACVSNPVPHPGVEENASPGFSESSGSESAGAAQGGETLNTSEAAPEAGAEDFASAEGPQTDADALRPREPAFDVEAHDGTGEDVDQAQDIQAENDLGPWPD